MVEVVEIAKKYLGSLSPAIILLFSILATAGFIKWSARLADSFRTIMKHPAYVILVLIVAAVLFYFYFKFAAPLLE
ncbi:hypothetical protein [Acholeplasma hippikon]|uniref:Uncharacterized protein n=1 Tax=Acholeplasma hippikon TaxID=264636 RepID=A0A449BKZ8_9MOLU|nr:hypothetical protein [Acholeplasma hippikon]VEU83146.1 Uncharacterised protein [Acholeplasma hippikon]VEU83357.1 Uncharacterised protein [Acholeplasma hippikon]